MNFLKTSEELQKNRSLNNEVTQQKSEDSTKETSQLQSLANQSEQVQGGMLLQNAANQSEQVKSATQLKSAIANTSTVQLQSDEENKQSVTQRQENKTGLPDNLKSGVENLSGHSLDDVKVHYNSSKPAQLNAHAYAQGSDIHLASGQEKHLPHEAWHVAQQKQGRVQATTQMKGVGVNTDEGLEREADVMGAKAMNMSSYVGSRLSSPVQTKKSGQKLGQTSKGAAQLKDKKKKCGGGSSTPQRSNLEQITQDHPLQTPRIGFRYDSRPIDLALENGYEARDPQNANITENGENQSMVGVAHHYVGAMGYQGYAKLGAHELTKEKWNRDRYNTYYMTAVVARPRPYAGYTYKWLLDRVSDQDDKDRIEQLLLTREGRDSDKELKLLARKHNLSFNVGTTEIVTDRIQPGDILGYYEIKTAFKDEKDRGRGTEVRWVQVKDLNQIEGYQQIPDGDVERYQRFLDSDGDIQKSNFL